MNIGSHGGTCGHSCCLRIQDLSVRIGGDTIIKDTSLHVHCGVQFVFVTEPILGFRLRCPGTEKEMTPS